MYKDRPSAFENAFLILSLAPLQRTVVENRFIPLVKHLRWRTWRTAILFHSGRIIVTVGSLIVPALLSIQTSQPSGTTGTAIYWSTWVVSLFVTICNALLTLFKIDKRYYYLHTCMEQLISDGWQYIELSGKYSGFNTPDQAPTHSNQFIFFCHSVEKIRMKQVEEEYFKLIDMPQQPGQKASIDSLVPPTPLKDELRRLMQTIDSPIVNGPNQEGRPADSRPNAENTPHGTAWTVPMLSGVSSQGSAGGGLLQSPHGMLKGFAPNPLRTEIQPTPVEQGSKSPTPS
jgi:hypothetical protein